MLKIWNTSYQLHINEYNYFTSSVYATDVNLWLHLCIIMCVCLIESRSLRTLWHTPASQIYSAMVTSVWGSCTRGLMCRSLTVSGFWGRITDCRVQLFHCNRNHCMVLPRWMHSMYCLWWCVMTCSVQYVMVTIDVWCIVCINIKGKKR